jgi:acetylornithine deacetylase
MNVTELLAGLISFPTVSSASNLSLLDWVETVLAPLGGKVRRFPNEDGTKANLLVVIGPEAPGGIILSGHTDVVPTEGQAWTGDPFVLREKDGMLIGRGADDMKGFLACAMALALRLKDKKLKRPVILAFSYDEEVGCTGVWSMAEWLGNSDLKPELAIIGESSNLKVVNAHKSGMIGWTHVTGKPGHSSQPDLFVNAVMISAHLIAFIDRIRVEMREKGPRFEGMTPPYSTIQVNQISGGLHGNIVPEHCKFFWEMRVVPGVETNDVFERITRYAKEELEPAMKAIDPNCGIRFDVQAQIPPLAPTAEGPIVERLMALSDGQKEARQVSYGTEAGIIQRFGVPAVVWGPGGGMAHQPDEATSLAEMEQCVALMEQLVDDYLC